MQQCWDADPEKRPDIKILKDKIGELNVQNEPNKNSKKNTIKRILNKFRFQKKQNNRLEVVNETSNNNIETNYASNRLFTSKVYQFENFPEPRNATEGEQEGIYIKNDLQLIKISLISLIYMMYHTILKAFHSKIYSFNIPYNIDDNNNSSNHQSSGSILEIVKDNSKNLSEAPNKKLQTQTNDTKTNLQNDYKREIIQVKKHDNNNTIDEIYDNPNFHAEEQDELEIPDDLF